MEIDKLTTNCTNITNTIGFFLLMKSFILIRRILRASSQKFFKQNKTFNRIKADHGLSSVRKKFVRLDRLTFPYRAVELNLRVQNKFQQSNL